MKIEKICPMCRNTSVRELDIESFQLDLYYLGNKLIQEVFPNLTSSEREFIITGYCEKCMTKLFGE